MKRCPFWVLHIEEAPMARPLIEIIFWICVSGHDL